MNDGSFAHEFGDTWHGNDWWYDELDFNLGYPLRPAQLVPMPGPPGTNMLVNGSFETAITDPWRFWVDTGYAATVTRDTANPTVGAACARVDVTQTLGTGWRVEFAQWNRSLTQGVTYAFTFWARSSTNRYITVGAQKASPDWRNYDLYQRLAISTNWQNYKVTFTANATVSDSRLQFFFGETTGTVWLDDVQLYQAPPEVFRRDFNNGIALLNASGDVQTVSLGAGFHRLTGSQAPMFESILDDQATNFSTTGAWTNLAYDSGLWKASGPFYHSWSGSLHERTDSSGEARWQIPIATDDTYTISAWWPAGPRASNWTSQAAYQVVAGGVVVASTNLNQTTGGDQWHDVATVSLSATNPVYVRLSAPSGPCVTDALHLRSQTRFNNGQPASSVSLQPMDGIILQRDQRLLGRPGFRAVDVSSNSVMLLVTNLTPGIDWVLERATNPILTAWQVLQTFQTSGFESRLTDAVEASGPRTSFFFRVRTN